MTPMRATIALFVSASALALSACGGTSPHHDGAVAQAASTAGRTRTYFIAADEATWEYMPGGVNGITFTRRAVRGEAVLRSVE